MSDPAHLLEQLEALAAQLRTGRSAEACAELPAVMDVLARHMAVRPAADQQAFAVEVAQALQAWERHDWLGLADSLAHDLAAVVEA